VALGFAFQRARREGGPQHEKTNPFIERGEGQSGRAVRPRVCGVIGAKRKEPDGRADGFGEGLRRKAGETIDWPEILRQLEQSVYLLSRNLICRFNSVAALTNQ